MLTALTDLKTYKSTWQLTDRDLREIGDFNHDYNADTNTGGVTNADIQPLLDLIASGGASVAAVSAVVDDTTAILPCGCQYRQAGAAPQGVYVPEPSGVALGSIGIALLLASKCRRLRSPASCGLSASILFGN